MRSVHAKDMVDRRDGKLIADRYERSMDIVYQLRSVSHGDFVRMPVEDIQGDP